MIDLNTQAIAYRIALDVLPENSRFRPALKRALNLTTALIALQEGCPEENVAERVDREVLFETSKAARQRGQVVGRGQVSEPGEPGKLEKPLERGTKD